MTSDQARQRAERNFKREERAQDGRKAMIEYEAQAAATRKKTARLKALRLAKEAQARKTNRRRPSWPSVGRRPAANSRSFLVIAFQLQAPAFTWRFYEKWIKETPLDIRPGSRPQVARTKESTRSINCAPFEKVRGRDTTKSVQYRIIARLARVISRTRRHRHYTAILRPRASHRRSAIEVFAEVPGVHRRQHVAGWSILSSRTTAPR